MVESLVGRGYGEEDLLPISGLQHLLFCERRAALIITEGAWGENEFTARGVVEHERVHECGGEARGDVVIARGLRLRSLRLGLVGQADVVEFHRRPSCAWDQGVRLEGRTGVWQPVPVEYKSGHKRVEDGYEVQLCAQAMCLEEMLNMGIPSGALYYAASQRRLDVPFGADLRDLTRLSAARLHEVIDSRQTPAADAGPKCRTCSLNALCLPATMRGRRASQYLTQMAALAREDEL